MKDDMPKLPKEKKDGPEKWEIESWVRTIMDAEEIKGDSEKWKVVEPMLAKKAKAAVKTMEELRRRSKEAMDDMEYEDADA